MADQGLDDEFKQVIAKMKPFAKRLPHKSEERSKVTAWIKKLLTVKNEKSERNEYAKLLLQVLQLGKLEPPFSSDPPHGSLPRLNTFQPLPATSRFEHQPLSTQQPTSTQSDRTWYPLESTNLSSAGLRDERQPKTTGRRHTSGTKHSRVHSQRRKSKSQSRDHGRTESTGAAKSPLYSIQTNLPNVFGSHGNQSHQGYGTSSVGSHGNHGYQSYSGIGQTIGGSVYTGGDGLWNMDNRPSFAQGPQTYPLDGSRSPPLLNKSVELEDLLPSSPSLSDDVLGSDDSQLSEVSELLMGGSEHWTRSHKAPETRQSFGASASYSPQKIFTPSIGYQQASGSPISRKHDVTREILQSREVELKVKAAENRFEEEKLKIQKSHEEALKQILDRKNNELENLRTESHLKENQLSSQARRLEMKLSQSLKENRLLREEGNQSLADSRQYRQKLEAQFEEKLHTVVSEFEQSKLELEEHHAKAHTRLIQEMSARVAAISEDCKAQKKADAEVISTLKAKLEEMSRISENLTQAHTALQQDKVRLEERCSSLEAELGTAVDRVRTVEGQLVEVEGRLVEVGEDRERQLREMRAKTEQSVQSVQQEYSVQEAKMCESISELKKQVSEMERETERVRQEHSLRVTEIESEGQRLLRQKDLECEKKVIELKREISEREFVAKERSSRLEEEIRSRDEQLEQMRAVLEQQSNEAEKAIEEFKVEVEQQTSGMFDQMRGELAHLERELNTCRADREAEREQHTREWEQTLARIEREKEEVGQRHREAMKEMVTSHRHKMEAQREALERAKEEAVAKLSSELTQLEAQARAKESHSRKVVSSLEEEVRGLREQLEVQAHHHGDELEERDQRARDEVEAAVRIHESAIGKLKTQLDTHKTKLREDHRREVASLVEEHEHKLRQLEHQHSHKNSQLTETINSLKTQIKFLEESLEKQQSSHEDHVRELMRRTEEEMTSLKHHHESIRKSLQQEAEAAHLTVTQHQERNRHQQAEHSSKLSQLKLSYEERLRGMLPVTMKQDYEDTIKSLRSQVSLLQQRAGVLQEELNQRYSAHSHTPKKHSHS